MDRSTCAVAEERHPWDVDHPYIERVAGGWQRKSKNTQRVGDFWHDDPNIRNHPVLYLLFGYAYTGAKAAIKHRRWHNRQRFERGMVISDADLKALPQPKRWPATISHLWPELNK